MEPLEELDSILFQLEHRATGARHVHISNRDKENTFGVAFRTVPEDSTGVAHILEHTVLCGSEKFDVRDPFFSMLKRGLSTFMNAFTASDWTMYPFSTQNSKDFYNLMDVYLDAAFFPRLDPLSFKQEGHRMEVAASETPGEASELIYKGVVYNEMKGAMSSPSQVMGRSLLGALYPDTTYSFNSGGEPSDIPALTHDGLKAFHARFYHPSNAFFYTYGSIPLKDHLLFIEEKVLKRFTKIDPDSAVPSQPRWDAPRTATVGYPLARDEDPSNKYQACVAWLTADVKDSFEMLVLGVLELVLLGNAASPLRKALIDSGLGSALSDGSGFDPDMRDTMFACGLKEIAKGSESKVETVIFDTLEAIVSKGVDKTMVESAIHQIEFHRKEITNSPHPFGIKLLLSLAGPWIHEGDPVVCLKFDADLERLNQEMEKGGFLEERIRTYFLDNPHRVLFTLAPDQEMEKNEKEKTAEALSAILKETSAEGLARIEADAATLAALQDAKEDLSSLPTLELGDVPPEIEIVHPDTVDRVTTATCYDKATSGILYFSCPTGLGAMPEELFPLIPFFCRTFTGAGTAVRDYAEMAERMNLYTGGVSLSPVSGTGFSDQEACLPFVALQGKALDRNVGKLFEIITEFVSQYSFSDHTRLKSLLLQYKAGMEGAIVSNGHRYAISLASRNLTQASFLGETWHGISQFQYIKALTDKVEEKETEQEALEGLERDLRRIAGLLFKQENLRPAIVGEKESLGLADASIRAMIDTLPKNNGDSLVPANLDFNATLPHEGWSTSTQVSFVAQAFKTVRMGHDDAPALSVIAKMLRSLYLHREIREKGGAYGGFAMYSPEEGIFSFGSYRDPYIRRTLSVYRDSCDFIINGDYSEEDVKEAILQVCAEIDKPETPGPASIKAFYRDILKLTDDKRKQFKAALLKLDKGVIQGCAQCYFKIEASKIGTAVISGQDLLDAANQELAEGQRPLELHRI
ncbi:MAG: insulinase family protein [Desulfobacterium sp.]|nr:insulinase family protein [Desulfobacterium sp.]